ncbi:GAF domain-containing protein [bacterium]|nr:GAF domain-containing protein [bacterium]
MGKGGNLIADLGNVAAVLNKRLDYYWVGFYFLQNDRLVLGPFQGTPACVYLDCRKGVCGASADSKETLIVEDVNTFEGHVACDPRSKSEIVVPCFDSNGKLRALLDVDSDQHNHFDDIDRQGLEKISELIKGLWLL